MNAEIEYGEPVALRGKRIYFTSWKYVFQGQFSWKVDPAHAPPKEQQLAGIGLSSDGVKPAEFRPSHMPRGIRLAAQEAAKLLYDQKNIGGMTVYDQGKYMLWETVSPCSRPEPFSTKDKILIGHNHHLGYLESEDGLHWKRPKLGLIEFDGSKENHIVFRGDLNGSTRGWHGGSIFVDPTATAERYKMVYLGVSWSRAPGGPVLRRGPLGGPDGGYIVAGVHLLEYPGDRWGIPYAGYPIPHKYPGRVLDLRKGLFPGVPNITGLAVWPKGRLVALQCDEEGEFCTVGIVPPTNRIRLNATVAPAGCISASVLPMAPNVPGRPADGSDRIVGDGFALPVTWGGDADMKPGGAPVRLRFRMRSAKLYAIEFY